MAFGCNSVRTGNHAYIEWDFECTFNCCMCVCLTGCNAKVFGLEQRVSGWTWTNNRITLSQMNSVEPKTFAYGQARGSMSIDFVVSNPWYNSLLFERSCCFPSAACCIETFTWENTSDAGTKCVESFTAQIGVNQAGTNTVRTIRGGLANSISLRSSIGETVKASMDVQYANDVRGTSLDASPASETVGTGCSQYIPYTFAHGSLQFTDACCCASTVAELQSFDITLNQNADLLWGHGSNKAVTPFRRLFEMTGTFQASWTCYTLLDAVYAQIADNCICEAREQTSFVLTLDNGLSDTNQRKITYTFTGIGIADHSTTVEPNEPIFENINWQARRGQVVAVTNDAAEPS